MFSQTDVGFEVVLKSTGIARFFGAGFLGIWLIGWIVGETFALWLAGAGAWSFLTGQPPGAGHEPVSLGIAIVGGLFLFFWLSLWTVGGIAAIWEFLRLLCGKDRIEVTADGVRIENGYGLFRSTKNLRRDELRCFYNRPNRAALCVDTVRSTIELTRVGTWQERVALAQKLNAQFDIAPEHREGQLPTGWCEVSSPERENILVRRSERASETSCVCVDDLHNSEFHYGIRSWLAYGVTKSYVAIDFSCYHQRARRLGRALAQHGTRGMVARGPSPSDAETFRSEPDKKIRCHRSRTYRGQFRGWRAGLQTARRRS